MAQAGANTYKGNATGSTANISDVATNTAFNQNFETLTSNIQMDGVVSVGTLSTIARADHRHASDTSRISTTLTPAYIIVGNSSTVATGVSMSGDATINSTGTITIGTNVVTNAKSAQMGANTYKGNATGSTANASDISINTAFNQNFETSTSNIKANGAVSVGTLSAIARADHVHQNYTTTSQTSNYVETNTNGTKIILCSSSSGTFSVTLPTAVSNTSVITVKKTDTSNNIVTILANGSQTMDGQVQQTLFTLGDSLTFISDNANWWVI